MSTNQNTTPNTPAFTIGQTVTIIPSATTPAWKIGKVGIVSQSLGYNAYYVIIDGIEYATPAHQMQAK